MRMAPEIFQGWGVIVELAHFHNYFVENKNKKDATGECFGVFSPKYY